jgi:hypothetical protein
MIKLRRLRLVGTTQNYPVDFIDDDGEPMPLAIVRGEITTGKTAVLEFVDYCLGKKRHPSYLEIKRQVRSAQLELSLDGEIGVIERPLFSTENSAWLHDGPLEGLERPHGTRKIRIDPAGDPNTLNWMLLSSSGLEGIRLKEAPTKEVSQTDPLSFRDVMWLAFLESDRLLARHLLHESGDPMKRLKLRQLVEVIFGVHDQDLAAMGERISLLESERGARKIEIASLQTFLAEQEVEDPLEVQAELEVAESELGPLLDRIEKVDTEMKATSDFADELRRRYRRVRDRAGELAGRIRDRETLLARLVPLRGQYAEDEGKLVFFDEAQQLFDPVGVHVCPACLNQLEQAGDKGRALHPLQIAAGRERRPDRR